jgi:DNA repair protein RecO (recombination protein O)
MSARFIFMQAQSYEKTGWLVNARGGYSPGVETTAAILLRKTKLTETSLIVTWLTGAHGRLKTVAKGARRPRSAFAGKLDLFFGAEIQFARSKKTELHTLREVVLKNPREGVRKNYRSVQLASYFVELVELVTEPDHAVPEIYDLLKRALDYLDANAPTKRALLHFESELTRVLGVQNKNAPSPAQAIGQHCGRLPQGRQELLLRLG